MRFLPLVLLAFHVQNPTLPPAGVPAAPAALAPDVSDKPLDRGAHFAFVDREYIFTVEMVGAGIALLNFISMSDTERLLSAKSVRVALGSRKVPAKFFLIDTGNPKEPVITPSVRIRPRSSFGVRLQGEFGNERELNGVTIGLGDDDFRLVALSTLDFENLALKINRLNLGSPDFRDDWRVLKIETLGDRAPARVARPVR